MIRRTRALLGGVEEENKGIARRIRESPAGMDKGDEEVITLKFYFLKKKLGIFMRFKSHCFLKTYNFAWIDGSF